MNCPECDKPLRDGAKFCPECGAKIRKSAPSQRIGAVAVDATHGQSIINIGASGQRPGADGDYCPICGAFNPPDKTFRCVHCSREFICLEHRDAKTYFCSQCAAEVAPPPAEKQSLADTPSPGLPAEPSAEMGPKRLRSETKLRREAVAASATHRPRSNQLPPNPARGCLACGLFLALVVVAAVAVYFVLCQLGVGLPLCSPKVAPTLPVAKATVATNTPSPSPAVSKPTEAPTQLSRDTAVRSSPTPAPTATIPPPTPRAHVVRTPTLVTLPPSEHTLLPGSAVSATLGSGDLVPWEFTETAGRLVDIVIVHHMSGWGDNWDPVMELFSPEGTTLVTIDDWDDWCHAEALRGFQLPASGKYTVWVSSGMRDAGIYVIMLLTDASKVSDPRRLDHGQSVAAYFKACDLQYWLFSGSEGQLVDILLLARQPGCRFAPVIQLYGPDGQLVTKTSNTDEGPTEALRGYRLPESGLYTIWIAFDAHYWSPGEVEGEYTLTLLSDASKAADPQRIETGQTVEGDLDAYELDHWVFAGQEGELVDVLLGSFSANCSFGFELFGPDGQSLKDVDEQGRGIAEALRGFRLPASGDYTIWVSGCESTYSLSLR